MLKTILTLVLGVIIIGLFEIKYTEGHAAICHILHENVTRNFPSYTQCQPIAPHTAENCTTQIISNFSACLGVPGIQERAVIFVRCQQCKARELLTQEQGQFPAQNYLRQTCADAFTDFIGYDPQTMNNASRSSINCTFFDELARRYGVAEEAPEGQSLLPGAAPALPDNSQPSLSNAARAPGTSSATSQPTTTATPGQANTAPAPAPQPPRGDSSRSVSTMHTLYVGILVALCIYFLVK